jgi:predicted transcriptional regulator YheO
MKLRWLKSPVKYEQNDLKDIRGLADTGKLYFLISTFTCSKDNAVIGIICINANLGYRFELHTQASGKEVLSMIPELDDALQFRH